MHIFNAPQDVSIGRDVRRRHKSLFMISPAFVLLYSVLAGCSTIVPPEVYDQAKLDSVRTAYVVKSGADGRNMSTCVAKALRKKGIDTSYGDRASIPAEADIYLTVEDEWMWDIVMYLRALRVVVVDVASNQMVASGEFSNKGFHSYPDVNKKCFAVIDSIFRSRSGGNGKKSTE